MITAVWVASHKFDDTRSTHKVYTVFSQQIKKSINSLITDRVMHFYLKKEGTKIVMTRNASKYMQFSNARCWLPIGRLSIRHVVFISCGILNFRMPWRLGFQKLTSRTRKFLIEINLLSIIWLVYYVP